MKNYEVGYGRPPIHSRFKKGECPNPRGRGRREPSEMAGIIDDVLSEEVEYREGPRTRKASRRELRVRKLFSAAIRGDVRSADDLLKLRVHAGIHGDAGPLVIQILNDPEGDGGYSEQWIKGGRGGR
jgi:Family of unknown function (DUF5681)